MTRNTKEIHFSVSASKIKPPFEVDPTMLFYSPQETVDAFSHPRVSVHHDWVANDWVPPDGFPRIALIIPCTKLKPYPTSREHRSINRALMADGWEPDGSGKPPLGLDGALDEGEDRRLLDVGTMFRRGVALDRIVISEPLGLVPYTHVYEFNGDPSPASGYDCPGLFESRGTSVSPWREDHTAVQTASGRWTWGPREREAYVTAHNTLVDLVHQTLHRVGPRYGGIVAWVSPGLTHRSFLMDERQRKLEGLPLRRKSTHGMLALRGVRDQGPSLLDILPTTAQMVGAQEKLAERLKREGRNYSRKAVQGVYARGDGHDTPLGLPELLTHLVAWINKQAAEV
jgi:hypothetical protein